MTKRSHRTHAPAFKAKVALDAIKVEKTLAELAQLYDVARSTIRDNLRRKQVAGLSWPIN